MENEQTQKPEEVTPAAAPAPTPAAPAAKRPPRRLSRHLARAWILVACLAVLGAVGAVGAAALGRRVSDASAELAQSTVPDEALSAAFLAERRAQIDAETAAVGNLFVPRENPSALLSEIERRAAAAGVEASVSGVALAPYGENPESPWASGQGEVPASAPYAVVVVTVGAQGPWRQVITFARDLESLPYAARLERLRLSAAPSDRGVTVWSLVAEVRAAAR